MGKTILELFKGSPQDKSVKADKETLVEQETSGIRVKSAVELNNPGIYGNEATRIVQRSTPDLEKMKKGTGGEAGDDGLIGKGLSKLGVDGGIGGLRDKVNTTLGIPVNQIPSRVIENIKDQDSQTPIVPGQNGTEVGKLLKESGGNPKTILKQGAGKLIGKAKDKLRGALFGSPDTLGIATPEGPKVIEYTDKETYSKQATDENRKSYSKKDDFKAGENKDGKLDLSLVSPLYGIRRSNAPKHGESIKASEGISSNYSPEAEGFSYNKQSRTTPLFSKFGLGVGDSINLLSPADDYTLDDDKAFAKVGDKVLYDFIPVWMKKIGTSKPVMFRALISGLTENVSPSWSTSKFVGNPYNFYTFDSIERSTSFNLKMYCNSPLELNNNWEKITKITQMTYPSIGAQYANAPIMQFRIGDIYNNKIGFIDSLTYTIPDDSNWETDGESGYLPKIIDVAISIKFIESVGAEDRPYAYTISEAAAEAINDKRGTNAEIGASQTEGDGNVSEDKPEKITPKGYQLSNPLDGLKAPKIPVNLGSGKKQSTPADTESAKLPDNANQGGLSDKLDGKSVSEAVKEAETIVLPSQATIYTSLKTQGYKEYKGSGLGKIRQEENDDGVLLFYKSDGFDDELVRIKSDGSTRGPYKTIAGSEAK